MIRLMSGFPDDVLAVEVYGRITQEDYKNVLIPAAEEKLARRGKVKMLCVIGLIDAFDLAAIWEDAAFGIKHWREFSHVALVTDYDWIKSIATLFVPFIPAKFRMYRMRELDRAQEWLGADGEGQGQKVA